ncbi:[4Fe-4S] proteins maturation [Coemansia sp. RSA 1843]|nr:[4Fe-4S] proteins maturation [Coemansia sp. RSA 1843]
MLRCCCQQLVQIQKPATAAFAATAKSLRAATANPYSTNNAAAETPKNTSTTTATFSLPKLSKQEIAELESKISSYSNPQTTPIKKDAIPHVSKEVVHLTDSAIGRLKYLSEQRKKTQYLRLRVDSGGCYGFSYMLDMTDEPETDDVIVDRNGAKMVVDEVSLPLVRGAIIDWQDRLIGQAFVVLANPNSSGGCGCGSSFEIKMD